MKTFRASMILPLFGLLASLAACGGQSPADGSAATSSSVTTEAQADQTNKAGPDHHKGGMHMGGPASLVFAALHEPINLTAEQRTTIESTLESLKPQAPKAPPGADAHEAALVAAIRKNDIKVETLAFKPVFEQNVDREAALAKALTTLHATLTPEQRTQLVAAVQKHMSEGPKGFGDHGPKADKDDKGGNKDHGPKGWGGEKGKHGGFGPMRMLEGLDLTKEQTDAIHAQLSANKPAPPTEEQRAAMKAQHEAMKKEMDARLQTFVGDGFDATAFLAKPANAPAKMGFDGGDRFVKDLAVIVPILTPAQRETLATKIEQGPAAPPAMNTK